MTKTANSGFSFRYSVYAILNGITNADSSFLFFFFFFFTFSHTPPPLSSRFDHAASSPTGI